MQTQFSVELMTLAVVVIGFIIWLVRLESQVLALKDANQSLRESQKESERDHEAELQRVIAAHKSADRTVWEKIDSVQSMLGNVLQTLGRLEGKMEISSKN